MFFHQSHQVASGCPAVAKRSPSVGCNGFLAVNVLGAWRHVQLYIGNACAILSTVSLFLHEQVHSIQTEEVGAIPLDNGHGQSQGPWLDTI